MKEDLLSEAFRIQREYQERLGDDIHTTEFRTIRLLALIDEATEALHEIPWKPWKKNQEYNEDRFREELIDCFHFIISLFQSAGLDSESVLCMMREKNRINHSRLRNGY